MKIGRWGLHGDLIRAFREIGINTQHAVDAASIAERAMRARRDHYIKTEVLAGKEDIEEILLAIMAATGVDAEAVETARATFRGDLRRRQGQRAISPASTEIPVGQARPALDDITTLPGATDGQSLGLDAGAMG